MAQEGRRIHLIGEGRASKEDARMLHRIHPRPFVLVLVAAALLLLLLAWPANG